MLPRDAHAKSDQVAFLDVREPHEFSAGHVAGSLHIPLMQLPARYEELQQEATWVVVCQIGQRSDLAARFLRGHGIDAHNLDGGIEAWLRQGLPISGGRTGEDRLEDGHGRVLGSLPEPDQDVPH